MVLPDGSVLQLFIIKTFFFVCLQARDRYEKMLEDVTSYTPRYMEEMEAIFEQSQEEERKRISFLKQAFLSIHRHLDITNNERWDARMCKPVCTQCVWMTGLIPYKVFLSAFCVIINSVSRCQCEGSVQWTPPHSDVHRWAGRSQMVEEQPWPRDAY